MRNFRNLSFLRLPPRLRVDCDRGVRARITCRRDTYKSESQTILWLYGYQPAQARTLEAFSACVFANAHLMECMVGMKSEVNIRNFANFDSKPLFSDGFPRDHASTATEVCTHFSPRRPQESPFMLSVCVCVVWSDWDANFTLEFQGMSFNKRRCLYLHLKQLKQESGFGRD